MEQCGQQQQLSRQRRHGAVAGVGGGNLLAQQRHEQRRCTGKGQCHANAHPSPKAGSARVASAHGLPHPGQYRHPNTHRQHETERRKVERDLVCCHLIGAKAGHQQRNQSKSAGLGKIGHANGQAQAQLGGQRGPVRRLEVA